MERDRIEWSELSDAEKLALIPHILHRLKVEIWFYKFDGEPRSLELHKIPDDQ